MRAAIAHLEAAIADLQADVRTINETILPALRNALEGLTGSTPTAAAPVVNKPADPVNKTAPAENGEGKATPARGQSARNLRAVRHHPDLPPGKRGAATHVPSEIAISTRLSNHTLMLALRFSGAIAKRLGLKPKARCAVVRGGGGLVVAAVAEGGRAVYAQSRSDSLSWEEPAAHFGIADRHQAEAAVWYWSTKEPKTLLIDLPSWWPEPQVRSKNKNTPAEGTAHEHVADGRAKPTRFIPGNMQHGEHVTVEVLGDRIDPEFPCHTCGCADPIAAKRATMRCNECGGLYCAGCWLSHEIVHKRAVAHA